VLNLISEEARVYETEFPRAVGRPHYRNGPFGVLPLGNEDSGLPLKQKRTMKDCNEDFFKTTQPSTIVETGIFPWTGILLGTIGA